MAYYKNIRLITTLLVIILTLGIFISSAEPLTNDISAAPMKLTDNWQTRWGDSPLDKNSIPIYTYDNLQWERINNPNLIPPIQKDKNVWLRFKLPDTKWNSPAIQFLSYEEDIKVYLNEKEIYQNSNVHLTKDSYPWVIIPLPDDYQGKYLNINVYSPYFHQKKGRLHKTQIGSMDDIIASKNMYFPRIVREELPYIVLAFLFVFIGMFLQSTFFIDKSEKKYYFSLGFSSVFIGLWILSSSDLTILFLNAPTACLLTSILTIQIMPLGFCAFVEQFFGTKYKTITRSFIILTIIYIIIELLLDFTNMVVLTNSIYVYYLFGLLFIVITVNAITKTTKPDNYENKLFSLGLAIICGCIIFDFVRSLFFNVPWPNYITPLGMFVFLLFILYVLGRQYIEAHTRLDIYSKEIVSKTESLIENKKLLDEALEYDKLKNEFLANISHELRTPVNIILGSLQLFNVYLKDDMLSKHKSNVSKHVKAMQQNCFRLIRLVNNLIDTTKIDSGYIELNLTNCEFISLVEGITLSTSEYIESKGISLCFDTNVEEKIIVCDPDKIERIMLNLLSNAVKFSKPGDSIIVSINDTDSNLTISVEDTGIGIPIDKLDIIFERFRQVDKSLTRNHEGSGIGLSLVKSLVEMHDGQIFVESQVEKGSKFFFTIPVRLLENVDSTFGFTSNQSLVEKINIEFSDLYM